MSKVIEKNKSSIEKLKEEPKCRKIKYLHQRINLLNIMTLRKVVWNTMLNISEGK